MDDAAAVIPMLREHFFQLCLRIQSMMMQNENPPNIMACATLSAWGKS